MWSSRTQLTKTTQRIFSYADKCDWCLNAVALVASIGAGSTLPLMTIFFGQFVAKFNAFQSGHGSPDAFRSDVSHFV
jgi:ATP-binding cassette, subfamily B (MDR/TAP), member 1